MEIGIFHGAQGASPDLEKEVQLVIDAEADGLDSFWYAQVVGIDALTMIAVAGQRTNRIKMGTAVVPTFPRHPMPVAQQALTAQAATGGRLALGLGVSHRPAVEGNYGLPFEKPALQMREFLTVVRDLVYKGTVDFTGQVFRASGTLRGPEASPFPILIAALGPRMLRIAGELTEGTITWMVGLKTLETHIVPRINAAARASHQRCRRSRRSPQTQCVLRGTGGGH